MKGVKLIDHIKEQIHNESFVEEEDPDTIYVDIVHLDGEKK